MQTMLSASALVVIVHALTPPPLASPQQTPRPAPGSSLGRRSVLLGATSSLAALWAPVPARARMDPAELADIVERAKVGQLSTDRVISRALQNNLIDPKDVKNCGALEAIRYIDLQTIAELTPAQRKANASGAAGAAADPVAARPLQMAARVRRGGGAHARSSSHLARSSSLSLSLSLSLSSVLLLGWHPTVSTR